MKRSLEIHPGVSFGVLLLFFTVIGFQDSYGQGFKDQWTTSAFIEEPDGEYHVTIKSDDRPMEEIVKQLQPKKRKYKIEGESASIAMTYVVYEKAILGTRPFGRIRYNIELQRDSEHLNCSFKDFTFHKIEKSARYAKFEEVRGKPKGIASAKQQLDETQWSILRWKTDGVLNRKIDIISAPTLQAFGEE